MLILGSTDMMLMESISKGETCHFCMCHIFFESLLRFKNHHTAILIG